MSAKKTNIEFLNELFLKQPTTFNNLQILEEYRGNKIPIKVKDKYGICLITPNDLLRGSLPTIISAENSTEYCINKFKEKHGNKYDYSLVNYVNNLINVQIICPIYGMFEITPKSHLKGQGHKLEGYSRSSEKQKDSLSVTLEKFKNRYKDKYSYELINDLNYNDKELPIICRTHGVFYKSKSKHIQGQGCPIEGRIAANDAKFYTTSEIIERFKELHGDKYDYSKVDYKGMNTPVIISLKNKDFTQKPTIHLMGCGCQTEARERITKSARENPTGWTYTNWEKAGNKSKNFDSFKVYIIKCYSEHEIFYKIGKTFAAIKNRYKGIKSLPYKYQIVKEIIGDARYISELEVKLKNQYKDYKYVPQINFKGKYECFSELPNLQIPRELI